MSATNSISEAQDPGTLSLARQGWLGATSLRVVTPVQPRPARVAPGSATLVFPEGYVRPRSEAMHGLHEQMLPLLRGDAPVLLLGETGVGKDLVAQVLHASSARAGGPFVAVNCAAIPSELMEAEMFGIGRGIATGVVERPGKFQLARGGTLFLDEIGEMPLALQAKLLRALQGEEIQPLGGAPVAFDTRVVAAATNSDLELKMEQGQFRRDLYYRVAGFVLRVPPLRERRDDIPGLVEAFLEAFARDAGRPAPSITSEAVRALAAYPWPGNVRELQHEVRRLVYLCPDGEGIDCAVLPDHVLDPPIAEPAAPSSLRLQDQRRPSRAPADPGRPRADRRQPLGGGAAARHLAERAHHQDDAAGPRRVMISCAAATGRPSSWPRARPRARLRAPRCGAAPS